MLRRIVDAGGRGGSSQDGEQGEGEGDSSSAPAGERGGTVAAAAGTPWVVLSPPSSSSSSPGVEGVVAPARASTTTTSKKASVRRWGPLVACAAATTIAALSTSRSLNFDGGAFLATETVATMLMRGAATGRGNQTTALVAEAYDSYNLTARQAQQVSSFRSGRGLLLHLHLTHHAGTTFCNVLGASPAAAAASAAANNASIGSLAVATGAPPFACRVDSRTEKLDPRLRKDPRFAPRVPWLRNETQRLIDVIRPYYHIVSFEFGFRAPPLRLQNTDWENPNLVSVFVSRHPLERLLAGDAYVKSRHKIHFPNATHDDWWEFANMTHRYADNFMLRILSNDPECCQGSETPRERLTEAIDLLKRFTFVLDVRCLNEGMLALAQILGLGGVANEALGRAQRLKRRHNPDVASRYPYKDVYEHLARKNQLDLELYQWTQQNALVRCPSE